MGRALETFSPKLYNRHGAEAWDLSWTHIWHLITTLTPYLRRCYRPFARSESSETSLQSQNSANNNQLSTTLVFSKLYYCSTVWAGTSQQNIHKFQLIQNFAARIMTGKRKYDHISSSIKGLGWMTVQNHLQYRHMIPKDLSSKLSQKSQVHRYRTRQHDDLNVARCRTALAQRAFFVRAPKSWNSLNKSTRAITSLPCFKRAVMKEAFSWHYFLFTFFISILKFILF